MSAALGNVSAVNIVEHRGREVHVNMYDKSVSDKKDLII